MYFGVKFGSDILGWSLGETCSGVVQSRPEAGEEPGRSRGEVWRRMEESGRRVEESG